MDVKYIFLMLAVMACTISTATSNDFDTFDVGTGESDIHRDVREAFADESLFNISKTTGMTPGVPETATATTAADAVISAAGVWSLELRDVQVSRQASLTLYQTGTTVYGSGQIDNALESKPLVAGGSLDGSKLSLFLLPIDGLSVYRLDLTLRVGSVAGSYQSFESQGGQGFGMVSGILSQRNI
ncbi:MAG: hypothetical protein JW986_00715 [Methanotrichaceae archaeon]|nr:hypothetical protein [Methanotrichaceae archaeon]